MKGWFVIASGDDVGQYVWSETRNKARAIGASDDIGHYWEMRATRYKALDGLADTASIVPAQVAFDAGCNWVCEADPWCQAMTSKHRGAQMIHGVVHCEECAADCLALARAA